MNPSYKIFKLNSGEEIIGSVKKKAKGKIVIEDPMTFTTMNTFDMFGMEREITYLKPWTLYSKQKIASIKQSQIACTLEPTDQVIKMYQSQQLKNTQSKVVNLDPSNSNDKDEPSSEDLEKIMNDMFGGKLDSMMKFEFNLSKKDFEDLIEKGYLSEDFMDYILSEDINTNEGFSDEYTGDEKDHPNFGNRWTDWDIDPNDYLQGP